MGLYVADFEFLAVLSAVGAGQRAASIDDLSALALHAEVRRLPFVPAEPAFDPLD